MFLEVNNKQYSQNKLLQIQNQLC